MSASKRRNPGKRAKHASKDDAHTHSESARAAARATTEGTDASRKGRYPALRFVVVLVVLLAVFNYVYYVAFVRGDWLDGYLKLSAKFSGAILTALGESIHVSGTSVSSSRFAMQVAPGCDALQAIALFVLAVIAFPVKASMMSRLVPIFLGTLVLLAINFVRIASLYYVGAYYSAHFETVHIDIWQSIFIFLPLFFWLAWIWWALRKVRPTERHAGA